MHSLSSSPHINQQLDRDKAVAGTVMRETTREKKINERNFFFRLEKERTVDDESLIWFCRLLWRQWALSICWSRQPYPFTLILHQSFFVSAYARILVCFCRYFWIMSRSCRMKKKKVIVFGNDSTISQTWIIAPPFSMWKMMGKERVNFIAISKVLGTRYWLVSIWYDDDFLESPAMIHWFEGSAALRSWDWKNTCAWIRKKEMEISIEWASLHEWLTVVCWRSSQRHIAV